MKTRNILGMMAMASLLLGSCSQEEGLDVAQNQDGEKMGTVCFTLSTGATTRADSEVQSTDEKEVKTLYVVAFKDIDATATAKGTTTTDSESSSDTYVMAKELVAGWDGSFPENTEKTFSMAAGNYQFCFVANPSADLVSKIQGLTVGVSTVATFKALVEAQDPDTKPMLMVSTNFYGNYVVATTADADMTDLGTVTLQRAMARVDIENAANGVTITNAKFVNRAVKSLLVRDSEPTVSTDLLSSDKEYTLNLAGNSMTPNKITETIYSYEQTNTTDNLPSIELTYTIEGQSGKTYKHTVNFKKSDSQIPLKRNYLYTIKLSNSEGALVVKLIVADWTEGTTFEISSETLGDEDHLTSGE